MTRFPLLALLAMAALPGSALALDLAMPFPVAGVAVQAQPVSSLMVPTGPFAAGALPVRRIEGAVDLRAYRLEAAGRSLTELASPLRAALEAQGYRIALDCETRACGGFDFRFAIEVMPEPGMHVDLGEFRYIVAETADEAVTLLVSRSPSFGFVQVSRVGPTPWAQDAAPVEAPVAPVAPGTPVVTDPSEGPTDPALPEAPQVPVAPVDPGDLIAVLEAQGHVALEDLVFASGSAALEERDFASLAALADWLKADPARSVALVGHTDASGALKANVDLSRKRAQGVRQVLLMRLGVAPGQVTAEGVGPLAPRASNLTEAGRQKNRRVEAVQTSTQ